jgi:hypothetical protein
MIGLTAVYMRQLSFVVWAAAMTAALIYLLLQLTMGKEKTFNFVREIMRKLFLAVDRRK